MITFLWNRVLFLVQTSTSFTSVINFVCQLLRIVDNNTNLLWPRIRALYHPATHRNENRTKLMQTTDRSENFFPGHHTGSTASTERLLGLVILLFLIGRLQNSSSCYFFFCIYSNFSGSASSPKAFVRAAPLGKCFLISYTLHYTVPISMNRPSHGPQ